MGDLQYASPATVSRAGMVFVDPKNLGYRPYWQRWANGRSNEAQRNALNELFDRYVPDGLKFIHEGVFGFDQFTPLKTVIPQTPLNMVGTKYLLKIFVLLVPNTLHVLGQGMQQILIDDIFSCETQLMLFWF